MLTPEMEERMRHHHAVEPIMAWWRNQPPKMQRRTRRIIANLRVSLYKLRHPTP